MTSKIEEKYKKILGTGQNLNAVPEQQKFYLGGLLRKERLQRGLTMEDVAEGVCLINTLHKIEQDTAKEEKKSPSYFLVCSLLTRMGMSAEKFEFYYDQKEAFQEKERTQLSAWEKYYRKNKRIGSLIDITSEKQNSSGKDIEENKIVWKTEGIKENKNDFERKGESLPFDDDTAYKQTLEVYKKKHHTVWENIWADWQLRIAELSCDILPKNLKNIWQELTVRKLFYTEEEWQFLYALAAYVERKKEYEKANKVYFQMYQNAMKEGMDDQRRQELLPEFCLMYGTFLKDYEKMQGTGTELPILYKRTEEIFLQGISINQKFGRAYFLHELLNEYFSVLCGRFYTFYNNKQNREEQFERNAFFDFLFMQYYQNLGYKNEKEAREETVNKLLKYGKYLVAWEIVCGNKEKAKRIIYFMKEEIGWDCLTLEHTCAVLEKQQD